MIRRENKMCTIRSLFLLQMNKNENTANILQSDQSRKNFVSGKKNNQKTFLKSNIWTPAAKIPGHVTRPLTCRCWCCPVGGSRKAAQTDAKGQQAGRHKLKQTDHIQLFIIAEHQETKKKK